MFRVFVGILLSTCLATAQDPEWDVAGVQGRVGFIVHSGLGEPLSVQLVEIRADALKGAIGMRIYANGQRLGLHMGREIDADTAIVLPDCADTVTIVVLQGRNFDSELEPIDTGVIELTPRPIRLSLATARLERPKDRPELHVTGIPTIPNVDDASVELVINRSTLRDTSGGAIKAEIRGPLENLTTGRYAGVRIETKGSGGRPYASKLTGSIEIVITYSHSVCGQIVRKTITKTLTIASP